MKHGTLWRALLTALCASSLYGQQGTGTISGTVTDAQQALVVGARIEVVQVGTCLLYTSDAADE